MTGLIDCNNFFVSCEQVFNPALRNKPVVVLSNNDGCVVAMSNEAKAMGITRGMPFFQIEDMCARHGVKALSSNYALYGDMSARVMATVGAMVPDVEIYSIDESFFSLFDASATEYSAFGRHIVSKVRRHTGIPTSVGIAPTKTLAKIAARFAKRFPAYHGACVIDDDIKRVKALSLTDIKDVWGIGRGLCKRLNEAGISSALEFASLTRSQVRILANVTTERTWSELHGVPCVDFMLPTPDHKLMCNSHSFSRALSRIEDLSEAISSFTHNLCRKLRREGLCARSVTVFLRTNPFDSAAPQYYNSAYHRLEEHTSDTITITAAAIAALRGIFRQGYAFKKAGVIISEIAPMSALQPSLFTSPSARLRRARLMKTIDAINLAPATCDSVHLASHPRHNSSALVKCQHRSRLFSTRLSDIISINCNG